MELNQKLAKRQRQALVLVGFDERFKSGVLRALDIDLQNVNEVMTCSWTLSNPNDKDTR
jgi:hypothetical protein